MSAVLLVSMLADHHNASWTVVLSVVYEAWNLESLRKLLELQLVFGFKKVLKIFLIAPNRVEEVIIVDCIADGEVFGDSCKSAGLTSE